MVPDDIFEFRSYYDFRLFYEESHERLGSGGFGVVYRGIRKHDGQEIAIKHVPLDTITWEWTTPAQDTFVIPKELMLLYLAQSCPGVIRLYDSWRDEEHLVLVMEYNRNAKDLQEYINNNGVNGALEEADAAHILRQVIRTLQACQKKNVFHRDVKIENILYNQTTKETTLIDFGCGELTKSRNEVFRRYMGTTEYIPPEYFVRASYTAEPATVWQIGCFAFTMIFGRSPFNNEQEIIQHHVRMDPGVGSIDCRLFIRKCLNPFPEERPSLADLMTTKFLLEKSATIIEETPPEPEEQQAVRTTMADYITDRDSPEHSRHQFIRSQRQPSRNAPITANLQPEIQQIGGEIYGSFRGIRNLRRPQPRTSEPSRNRPCVCLKRVWSVLNCCRTKF